MGNPRNKQLTIYIPAIIIVAVLALVPFHGFLTVWGSAIIGHYTLIRLWKEVLLAVCFIAAIYIFLKDKKIRDLFFKTRLTQLIIGFLIIELIWGLVAHSTGGVNTKALFYGWLSDTRYLIFFLVTLVISKKTSLIEKRSLKIIMYPAVIVVLFGLLQILVLPKDFLIHFGYGPNTIYPYETINHNSNYIRIFSTLRGANPLGAYLLLPLSLATILLIKGKKVWYNGLFILAGVAVMIFTFSRSAWLGLIVALALSIYFGIKDKETKNRLLYLAVILGMLLCLTAIAGRHNTRIQNVLFHTQTHSKVKQTSDGQHGLALKKGIKDIATHPLGRGPGTSGPASVYNSKLQRSPENYYLQMGQETGWLGLAVFLAINVYIVLSLWARKEDTLSLALLTSFAGLVICNLLLPAWSDDTLAYLWWGLAAVVIATKPKIGKFKDSRTII